MIRIMIMTMISIHRRVDGQNQRREARTGNEENVSPRSLLTSSLLIVVILVITTMTMPCQFKFHIFPFFICCSQIDYSDSDSDSSSDDRPAKKPGAVRKARKRPVAKAVATPVVPPSMPNPMTRYIKISRYPNFQISKFPDIQISKYPNF